MISPTIPEADARDLLRRLVGLCADVHAQNPHAVRHKGGCGRRLFCDLEAHRSGGYRRVELLRDRSLLFHCENRTLRPGDLFYEPRLAVMLEVKP